MVLSTDIGGSELRRFVSPAPGDRTLCSGCVFGGFPNGWGFLVLSTEFGDLVLKRSLSSELGDRAVCSGYVLGRLPND